VREYVEEKQYVESEKPYWLFVDAERGTELSHNLFNYFPDAHYRKAVSKALEEVADEELVPDGGVSSTYDLQLSEGHTLEIESVDNAEWDGLSDPCPECEGEEFKHISYSGGHYGQYQGAVVERTDYWDQKGSLYTECLNCEEVLFKNPAFDVLQGYIGGEFEQ
jgi:hypothetical protein